MGAVAARPQREAAASSLLLAAGFAVAAVAALGGPRLAVAGAVGACLCFGAAVVVRRPFVPWQRILVALVLVILFIPLRRYKLPGDAGFSLEPYRILVAVILVGWAGALLVDPRVKLRASRLEGPITCIVLAVVGSVLANPDRVGPLQAIVLKAVTFLFSFVVVFYLLVSVVRTRAAVDTVVKTLVGGGAVVAVLAVIEARTGLTPFTRLDAVFPFLVSDPSFDSGINRGGATRAVGSAEHPIALGAAFVMLVPLAIYIVKVTSSKWWYLALGALVVGVTSTVSRTGILMLLVLAVVFLWLRGAETRRLWPIVVPLIVATHFAVPGTLGALKAAFFPAGGLIAEQEALPGDCSSSGRVADIGPTLDEVGKKPFFGYGYGTRIVTGPDSNACILDNQWLGTLYELGLAGFLSWLLLFIVVARRFGRAARDDPSPEGWLLVAVTASVTAYAFGMFTFDALGFSQVTFLLFLTLGLGAAVRANQLQPKAV
jgi:O-antigen ligase